MSMGKGRAEFLQDMLVKAIIRAKDDKELPNDWMEDIFREAMGDAAIREMLVNHWGETYNEWIKRPVGKTLNKMAIAAYSQKDTEVWKRDREYITGVDPYADDRSIGVFKVIKNPAVDANMILMIPHDKMTVSEEKQFTEVIEKYKEYFGKIKLTEEK